MVEDSPEAPQRVRQRQAALSRWDNEGGARFDARTIGDPLGEHKHQSHDLTANELTHLRVRVIALENLVISLLAGATGRQIDLSREIAGFIAPRPGFTQHPLTIHAAAQMMDLVERSGHFRVPPAAPEPYKRTAVFDENTLPAGLRKEHRTKRGVWGVIRVLDGRLRYRILEPESEVILEPGHPGLVLPDQPHLVVPLGPMRMQVEFYDCLPDL